ncbi:hypothetical protein PRIPAC_96124, partial [Pristionchus pacificus]
FRSWPSPFACRLPRMHINQHAIVEEDFVECKRKRHSDDHNKEPISSIESIAEDEIIDKVGNQAQNVVCLDEGGVVVKWDETTPVENIPLEETHEKKIVEGNTVRESSIHTRRRHQFRQQRFRGK